MQMDNSCQLYYGNVFAKALSVLQGRYHKQRVLLPRQHATLRRNCRRTTVAKRTLGMHYDVPQSHEIVASTKCIGQCQHGDHDEDLRA